MGDVTSDCEIFESNGVGAKKLHVIAAATVDDGDTIAIDLSAWGIEEFLGIIGFIHTTAGSVVVQEQPTTAVSGDTLTITVGGSTDNKKRYYEVLGR